MRLPRAAALLCLALLTACAGGEVLRRDASTLSPPPRDIDIAGARLALDMAVWTGEWRPDRYQLGGASAYFTAHAPGWVLKSSETTEPAELTLQCGASRAGDGGNCAEVISTCILYDAEGEVLREFSRRFDSQTCLMAGETQAFRNEAHNNGQRLAQDAAEIIAETPGLVEMLRERVERRRAWDRARGQALGQGDVSGLEQFARTWPDDPRAAEIPALTARADAAQQKRAREAQAEAEAEAQPAAASPPTSASPEAAGASATALSCFDRTRNLCADYDLSSPARRDRFADQCRQMGSQVLTGQCPRSAGAFGCVQSSGGDQVATWVYGAAAAQSRQACQANGGRVIAP